MDRERLGRLLSVALVPLGFALLVLGVVAGDAIGTSLGAATIVLGGAFFWIVTNYSNAEFDLTGTPSFAVNLVQLGGVLVVFALLTVLVGDVESVTSVFRDGLPSSTYVPYAGLSMGVLLGGGVPYAMHRFDGFGETMSDSVPARTIGFSFTFGTYLLLILSQPASSVLYAAAYGSSRVVAIVAPYANARR